MTPWQILIGSLIAPPAPPARIRPAITNKGRAKAMEAMAALEARNRAAIVAHIRKARNGITLKEITHATGLNIKTVDKHVRRLHFDGLIKQARASKPGRAWVDADLMGHNAKAHRRPE